MHSELNSSRIERYVFLHHRDMLGMISYKFKGVYVLDKEGTSIEKGVVWKRVSKEVRMK